MQLKKKCKTEQKLKQKAKTVLLHDRRFSDRRVKEKQKTLIQAVRVRRVLHLQALHEKVKKNLN